MKTALWWLVAALLFSGLLGRLAGVNRELEAEREDIMRQAKPRARTAEEKVVDDETRRRAVERLNRGL